MQSITRHLSAEGTLHPATGLRPDGIFQVSPLPVEVGAFASVSTQKGAIAIRSGDFGRPFHVRHARIG
jgi:hypothetical protein